MRFFKNKLMRPKLRLADIKKAFTLNIGTLLFGAIFIYMVISIILYLTASHITSYQVTAGPLSRNQTYTALALRSEQLVAANSSGYLSYYVRDNSKVRSSGLVYGISDSKEEGIAAELNEDDLSKIRATMAVFANNFDSNNFADTYGFKYELEGSILVQAGLSAPAENADGTISGSQTLNNQTICFAPSDGIVLYSMDGYESVTEDLLTKESFGQKAQQTVNLRSSDKVDIGDPVYKIINSEEWSLYIPLTEKQTVALAGRETIRVKFLKDGAAQTGKFSIITKDNDFYCKITLTNGMVRYAADRFLEIELVTNTKSGLKIPLSSIVNKDFYVIPVDYEASAENQNEAGFLREVTDKSGNVTTEFVNATLYAEQDDNYCVDISEFSEGDVIVKPDSAERYTIKTTAPLEGVYSINKGYAVFRKISIIDQNEEYCIVETGTTFGIAQFDNIVLDSSSVKEEEILY